MNIRFLPLAHFQPAPGYNTPPTHTPPTAALSLSLCAGQIPGTTSALVRNWKRPSDQSDDPGQGLSAESPPRARARAFLAEMKQMRARRKTAKMLMVVLLVFALCYLPISVLNVLKR